MHKTLSSFRKILRSIPIGFLLVLFCTSSLWAQDRIVSGKITSADDGQGFPGVNIIVKGTTIGTVSDANGAFSIPDLPPGKHVFMVWHEAADGGVVERKLTVEIKPGETTVQQIEYSSDKLKLK